MKRIIKSTISFLIVSSMLLGITLPIAAQSLSNTDTNTNHNTVSEISEIPISERYHVIKNGYLVNMTFKKVYTVTNLPSK